jgi:hypothetical protein
MAYNVSNGELSLQVASPAEIAEKIQADLKIAIPELAAGKIAVIVEGGGKVEGRNIVISIDDSNGIPTSKAVKDKIVQLINSIDFTPYLVVTDEANKVYGTDADGNQKIYDKDSFGKIDTVTGQTSGTGGYVTAVTTDKNVVITFNKGNLIESKTGEEDSLILGTGARNTIDRTTLENSESHVPSSALVTSKFNDALSAAAAAKGVADAAQGTASTALANAATAQTTANEAKTAIGTIENLRVIGTNTIGVPVDGVLKDLQGQLTDKNYVDRTISQTVENLRALHFAGFIGETEPAGTIDGNSLWIETTHPITGLPTAQDLEGAVYHRYASTWGTETSPYVLQSMDGFKLIDVNTTAGSKKPDGVYYFGGEFNWLDFVIDLDGYVTFQDLNSAIGDLDYVTGISSKKTTVTGGKNKVEFSYAKKSGGEFSILSIEEKDVDWTSNGIVA